MTASLTIYIPCDVGQVRVRMGYGSTLSPVEATALRVIHALTGTTHEAAQIKELSTVLGLGERVALDLVHDLWRHGHVTIDFALGTLELSEDTRRRLQDGQLHTLQSLDSEERTVDLMVERLTGHVMPATDGAWQPQDGRLAVRHAATDTRLEAVAQPALLSAVNLALSRTGRNRSSEPALRVEERPGRRVLSIRTLPQDTRTATGRRWYALDVRPEINDLTGALIVTVVDRRFPAARRELASARLTELAEEFRREAFATQLRTVATTRLGDPPLEEALARIAEKARGLAEVPGTQRRDRHDDLTEDAAQIVEMIGHRRTREVEHQVIAGADAHEEAMASLIEEAERQIVLVCPWIKEAAWSRVEPQLRAAVARNVQVVVVWGIKHGEKLDDPVDNALDSLVRQSIRTPVIRSRISARTHVKAIVCDDRKALVTSRNFLSAGGPRREVGLLISNPEGGASEAVRDLLGWVRAAVPEGPLSRMVLHQADRFPGPALEPPQPPALPERPPDGDDPRYAAALAAWRMAWIACADRLAAEADAGKRPYARLVEDGAHRELLWRALREARRRLVITSEKIRDEVLDGRLEAALVDCLKRGVQVTIGFNLRSGAAASRLLALEGTNPGLHLSPADSHCKVLVWDDEAVVGSFNFLSYAGYGTIGGRHQQRSELSLRLTGAAVADGIAKAAGEPSEVTKRVSGVSLARASVVDTGPLQCAQRILNRIPVLGLGAAVRSELDAMPNPWPVLDHLPAGPEWQAAAAFCLSHNAGHHGVRRALVQDLWDHGLFAEAGILDTDPPQIPRELAALGRSLEADDDRALAEAAVMLGEVERTAVLAVAVARTLTRGSDQAAELLTSLSPADGPWERLATLVHDHHVRTYGANPAELIRAATAGRDHMDLSNAWTELDLTVTRQRPAISNHPIASKVHAALFKVSGVFGRISAATVKRDLPALTEALKEFPDRGESRTVEKMVDHVWKESAPQADLLYGGPRSAYLPRLTELVRAARRVVELARARADRTASPFPPELILVTEQLATAYRQMRPELGGEPYGPLVTAALSVLDRYFGLLAEPSDTAGLWRYPRLTAAMTWEEGDLVGPLLADLADPVTVHESARRLIESGEYSAAEDLRDNVNLPTAVLRDISDQLTAARSAAITRNCRSAEELRRRAHRAGGSVMIDIDNLRLETQMRAANAAAALASFEREVEAIEARRGKALLEAEPPTDLMPEEVGPWRNAIRSCVEAREFAAAEALVTAGPGDRTIETPVPVGAVWPYRDTSLERVLSWYFDTRDAPPGFAELRPATDDTAAWELLSWLREAGDGFTGTLCRFLGTPERDYLEIPTVPGLPPELLGDGLDVSADGSPPCRGQRPAVWVAQSANASPPADVAMIDVPFLLRLVAQDPATRLTSFLYGVCARLPMSDVVTWYRASGPWKHQQVSGLLRFLGVTTDGVVVDALLHTTMGRPELLRLLLCELLLDPLPGRARHVTLDLPRVNRVRDSDKWLSAGRAWLLSRLDLEAQVLLRTAAAFDYPEFTLDDLRSGINAIVDDLIAEKINALPLDAAVGDLVAEGLIREQSPGRYTLLVRDLFAEDRPGYSPIEEATRAAHTLYRDRPLPDTAAVDLDV
ncbi:hypothetical protein [Microbispora triticiradicis]|uniref:PLD phosphodiesterase domain-containing protein n=2 Tax=Microbispora TaxID=2005 RepID=A0A5R8YWJ7_9ACTN|nr:hypothetical protein [Microbispora fusca]TLP57840.1 hypothetical protein FED44_19950 [Microbispora fusca]